MRHYSGDYTEMEVKAWADKLISRLHKFYNKPLPAGTAPSPDSDGIPCEAIHRKYASKKLMRVSELVQEWVLLQQKI